MREQNKERINNAYLDISTKLQTVGADALIICANTPHMVYPFVTPKIYIPILHIADGVGHEALKKGIKKLGLLGNRPTMTGGFIQDQLRDKFQMETIIPDDEFIDESHDFISKELTQGKFTAEAKDFFIQQMILLKKQGAEGIILGCTELPILINQKDFELPLMDTTQLHAQMASEFILED